MRPGDDSAADWKDAAAYASLLSADRSIFAWEWLRRDPDYRAAARDALQVPARGGRAPGPEPWGLHRFERPELAAPRARPIWRSGCHDLVLAAEARAGPADDAFDLGRLEPMVTIVRDDGLERLLLSDGLRTIRMDILGGTLVSGPVLLRYRIAGLKAAERSMLTLRRLLALCRSGRFSPTLHPPEARARRFILMLRVHDAIATGADQRTIASVLLDEAASGPRWRVNAPSLRSQVQRLVRSALSMGRGRYRALLRHRI